MKKTLLLSVVASTMIMAGGDIAPVEPVVAAPVEAAAWNFTGQAVAYMQTRDALGGDQNGDLFGGSTTATGLGLQLGATNDDIFAGIGFGAEVSAIESGQSANVSATHFGMQDDAALTQAYLTYGFDSINTSVKVGRQTLPKSLSPFAFSENWQVFQNTFEAALVVNSSIPNTTLVYAFVTRGNGSVSDLPGTAVHPWTPGAFNTPALAGYDGLNDFNEINDDGVHMVTAQNKSIDNLTLTGTWYIGPDHTSRITGGAPGTGDTNVLWGDATYAADMFTVGVQGGTIDPDGLEKTTGWGAKISGKLAMFDLHAAYTSVDDGTVKMANFGTSVKTPLYTQSILDQDTISKDSDAFKIGAGMAALGGNFGLSYINADLGDAAPAAVMYPGGYNGAYAGSGTYEEVDFTYKTKVFNDSTTLFAAYVYQNDDRVDGLVNADGADEQQNFLRFWARYNF